MHNEIEDNQELNRSIKVFSWVCNKTYKNNFEDHYMLSYVVVHYALLHTVVLYTYFEMMFDDYYWYSLVAVQLEDIYVHAIHGQDDFEYFVAIQDFLSMN